MLGPAIETYRCNGQSFRTCIILFLADAGCLYAVQVYKPDDSQYYNLGLGLLFPVLAFAIYWFFTLRVSLHHDGISVTSFLGRKEMRWDDVDRFYYKAMKLRVNLIPAGTYYTFVLIDRQGAKISLGHTVERPEQFGRKLIQFTQRPLLTRAIDQYNSGVEVSFGPVKVSRTGGVNIHSLWFKKQIAINQVASYRIDRGKFYIFRQGEKRSNGPEIRSIPNVFVLVGLLDAIFRPPAPKPQASAPAVRVLSRA